ncbi:MAG: alkaline shock response membrane anchor protein AmaP [Clostridia bacterium]|nr:alkaline shock response membrane anchor protein AmaP [Clostridia bacterium]MDD4386644.1 alkaline shock response membrane anchor protein AmaP [Clostridia bacterium]
MKYFKEFILVIFSVCMLGLAISVILTSLEIFKVGLELDDIVYYIVNNKILVMGIGLIVSILALFGIFSSSDKDENVKAGLAIKHEAGTVYITKDTFESIVLNVTRSFAALKNVKVSVNISEEGAYANVYTYIMPDTVVPTLTAKLQENIKDAVLKQTTVEIKEANIKIKGVYNQLEKKA